MLKFLVVFLSLILTHNAFSLQCHLLNYKNASVDKIKFATNDQINHTLSLDGQRYEVVRTDQGIHYSIEQESGQKPQEIQGIAPLPNQETPFVLKLTNNRIIELRCIKKLSQ